MFIYSQFYFTKNSFLKVNIKIKYIKVNSKFHIIRGFCEYLARFLSFHV